MGYEITIITEYWTLRQTVHDESPQQAINQVLQAVDESLEEFTIVCKRKDAPEGA